MPASRWKPGAPGAKAIGASPKRLSVRTGMGRPPPARRINAQLHDRLMS
jgi:hypothetical protein